MTFIPTNSTTSVTVPCGKCASCLTNKRNEWTFRLNEQLKISQSAHFVTLTYEEGQEKLSYRKNTGEQWPELDKREIQAFLKRLRYYNDQEGTYLLISKNVAHESPEPPKMKYYLVGEYGTKTLRPHYHAIIFDLPLEAEYVVSKAWQKGFTMTVPCTPATIHYVTKYVINRHENGGELEGLAKPFTLISSRPAIGHNYIQQSGWYHKRNLNQVGVINGTKLKLPRYYRDKIFNYDEKEKLAEQSRQYADKLLAEAKARVDKRGQNYFIDELNSKIQLSETFKKRNKKSTL